MSRVMTEAVDGPIGELGFPKPRDAASGRFTAGALDAPITGLDEEESIPGFARPKLVQQWPSSWRITPERLQGIYPEAFDELSAEVPQIPTWGFTSGDMPAAEVWSRFQKRLSAVQTRIMGERNLVTYDQIHGGKGAKPPALRCGQCGGAGKALTQGVCFGGCS